MIRVLVVDDLAFMRIAIRRMIEADNDMKVVGEARNGAEAVSLARELSPDVITMDIEMPDMNGLEATTAILASVSPPPAIVMVSATTQLGAADTLEALRRGAVDFVSKSSVFTNTDLAHIENELRPILRAWAGRARTSAPVISRVPPPPAPPPRPADLIVVGASTGGPQALAVLLRAIGKIQVPIVIAQHMPKFFTASLAAMLATDTGLNVREAVSREPLAPGSVTIIAGGQHGIIERGLAGFRLHLSEATEGASPSIDRLFASAAARATAPLGVLLTGMGRDGCDGALALHRRGATVLVQEPAECVVAGIPSAAIEAGVAGAVLPLVDLGAWIVAAVGTEVAR
jgi:two-component system chemotaxis response regulator CheB